MKKASESLSAPSLSLPRDAGEGTCLVCSLPCNAGEGRGGGTYA